MCRFGRDNPGPSTCKHKPAATQSCSDVPSTLLVMKVMVLVMVMAIAVMVVLVAMAWTMLVVLQDVF